MKLVTLALAATVALGMSAGLASAYSMHHPRMTHHRMMHHRMMHHRMRHHRMMHHRMMHHHHHRAL